MRIEKKRLIKSTIVSVCVAAAMAMVPISANAGSSLPGNFADAAEKYVNSRVDYDNRTDVRLARQPYKVMAQLKAGKEYECWAVDVRVNSSTQGAARSRDTYTVLFYNGRPTALKRDLRRRLTMVDSEARYAQR